MSDERASPVVEVLCSLRICNGHPRGGSHGQRFSDRGPFRGTGTRKPTVNPPEAGLTVATTATRSRHDDF
jgi:hypothetical protein